MPDWQPTPDQSRARYPDHDGFVENDGVRTFYEVYGDGDETVLFVPPWSIVHSRVWKAQIGYFSRHFRVVVFDPRGNGRSDRPADAALYAEQCYADDALAVLDATGTDRAHVITLSKGGQRSLLLATQHPERVRSIAFIGAAVVTDGRHAESWIGGIASNLVAPTLSESAPPGWKYMNIAHLQQNPDAYRQFTHDFFERFFPEPHSTKHIEDGVAWALETDAETMIATMMGEALTDPTEAIDLCKRLTCPTFVIHGTDDHIVPFEVGASLAETLGTRLEVVEASGHGPQSRKPVQVNLALRDFIDPSFDRTPRPVRPRRTGRRRVLYVSSPIGLGHAQRDVAIAKALRQEVDGLEVDWLAQDPVTRVLAAEGERIHPASAALANESKHIESESAEHDLHCFHALRRMDEILIHSFMVHHDVVRDGDYDLVIGDEAWEIDYYLHENPREKTTPYVWLTDFVGYLPMADGGGHEAFLTTDYNADMITHIATHPEVRDRAIFVGNPDDIVPTSFGGDLPMIRDWTEQHFDFSGYITGFDPASLGDRAALRAEVGYRDDEKVCIVSVGGSGVGHHLLRRVIEAFPRARRREPSLRMIVVAGPRIDPASLPETEGLEIVPYVHNLYRHLAACDLAVVQGGLTTSMELTANRRPFLYFPLRHHFEQNFHVRRRLERYGAGRCMDFDTATPEVIAAAITEELGREVDYRPVETDGAVRAAKLIAEVL